MCADGGRSSKSALRFAAAVLALSLCSHAHAAQPAISRVLPPGGQRGGDVELTIEGKRLEDAQEFLWYDPGIDVSQIEVTKLGVKARLHIADDCPLGEHAFRVRSAT